MRHTLPAVLLLLAGCSSSDPPTGPSGPPLGPPILPPTKAPEASAPEVPATPAAPLDGTQGAVVFGDVHVWMMSTAEAKVSYQDLTGNQVSAEPLCQIGVRIHNTSKTKKLDYRGWCGAGVLLGASARLVDEFGNSYRAMNFGLGSQVQGQILEAAIYPEKWVDDLLVFELPVQRATKLTLTLPGENVGGTGVVQIQLPRNWKRTGPKK
jgi:hypothetical protein